MSTSAPPVPPDPASPLDRFGRVDVLVNNAKAGGTVAVEDEELDRFRDAMEVNVTALWLRRTW